MDAKDLFKQALQLATIEVNKVQPEDYDKPTPDTDWRVKDLIEHMLYELHWTSDIVQGKQLTEVGSAYDGDLTGDDPAAAWQPAAQLAVQTIEAADLAAMAQLSYGQVTVEAYLQEAASDQLIHAWDLGMAMGDTIRFDDAVMQEVYRLTVPKLDRMHGSGLLASPVEVAKDAELQTRLLALYGRNAAWYHS